MVEPRVDQEDVLKTEELLVNIGPQHPSTHGVLRVVVRTDGEIVRDSKVFIGYLHRCFEKIAESVPYPQSIPYCDRMDYIASMNDGLAMCMTIEKLLGVEIPERAVWVRMIVCELNRIASHLIAVGTYGLDIGAFTPFFYAFREREKILDILEKISGGRLLYHYIRVGGQLRDLNAEIIDDIKKFVDQMEYRWPEYNELLSNNLIFVKRTGNVGVIPADLAIEYGLTGPCLRGSGVRFDLRKDEPYCFYDKVEFDVPVGEGKMGTVGDCWDRYWVRMLEIRESCKIILQCLEKLPEGPMMGKVSKVIRCPKGEVYFRAENPRGELGYYLVSDNKPQAYRFRARGPSFCNLSILGEVARDCLVADVIAIIGSIDIVLGEVDR